MALDFIAGCIGGCAGVIVGHPLDTVKVRLQTQDYRNPLYRGTWHCFSSILKKESVSGLYRGVTSPLGGVAVVNAIVFGVYGNVQRSVGEEGLPVHFLAGASAGLCQSFICSPVELAKTRLQLQADKTYRGTVDCLAKVFQSQGVRGAYKGLTLTIMREVPSFGSYFFAYELLTGGKDIATWKMLLAGGAAGSISWVVVYPVDVLKTRMQSDGINGPAKYKNAIHCLRESLKTEGYPVLTRGIGSTVIRAFPTNAITFTVVSWIMRLGDMVQWKASIIDRDSRPREKDLQINMVKTIFNQSIHLFDEGTMSM